MIGGDCSWDMCTIYHIIITILYIKNCVYIYIKYTLFYNYDDINFVIVNTLSYLRHLPQSLNRNRNSKLPLCFLRSPESSSSERNSYHPSLATYRNCRKISLRVDIRPPKDGIQEAESQVIGQDLELEWDVLKKQPPGRVNTNQQRQSRQASSLPPSGGFTISRY